MKRGEIWIALLDPKKGTEVGKQRPVLIVQTDLLSQVGHPTVLVLPMSSQKQNENVLRYKIENAAFHSGVGYALVDQIRAIDGQARLKKKIGEIQISELKDIGLLLKQVLDLS